MKVIHMIAILLLLIGGLNWGFVGIFEVDLVRAIFGNGIARVLFVLVGLSAVFEIFYWHCAQARCCK